MDDIIIAKCEPAVRMLAEAKDVRGAKHVADVARAAEVYAKRQKLGEEAVRYATAIKVDAMTLMGEFLREAPKNTGAKGIGKSVVPKENHTPTLAEQGIPDKKLSSDAQALAALKEEDPGLHEEVRTGQKSIREARAEKKKREKKKAREKAKASIPATPAGGETASIEQADCLEWFARQPAGSIDLVFGSPPYEQARLYLETGEDRGIARTTDQWVAWMIEVYQAALRCCKGLVAFVVEGQTKKYRWSASPVLLMAGLHQAGVHLRKPPVYRRVGIPGSGGPDWLRNDYEFIVCATNGGELPWSDNTAMGHEPKYAPGGNPSHRRPDGSRVNRDIGSAPMAERNRVGPHRARCQSGAAYKPPERANPGNVIDCVVGGGVMGDDLCHENEAPFPEALAEFFVRSFCPPGGVVSDPFSGSGTTAKVAVAAGRFFRGCDLRKSQVDLSLERVKLAQCDLPFKGANHEA